MGEVNLNDRSAFSKALYEKMKQVSRTVADMEFYEFQYALENITPDNGWASVNLENTSAIENRVNDMDFYRSIQIKPRKDGLPVLDESIYQLTEMLFVGLVTGAYSAAWVNLHFYFDVRSFIFMHRSPYFSEAVVSRFGKKPFRQFTQHQKEIEVKSELGYREFKNANREIDGFFISSMLNLVRKMGKPFLLAIAGQTAAGKTEIVDRLRLAFSAAGHKVTSIEMDNFFTDRDSREAKGVNSEGKEALHFELFKQCLDDLIHGKQVQTPRYNFLDGSSSHDPHGKLKPGRSPVVVEPADIIFMEGNFPFLLDEIAPLIRIKVVYLTDDPIRLKRKWRRDMDLRKKYEYFYFLNRYFSEQYIMARRIYTPQMEAADVIIDTTSAAAWMTPEMSALLDKK
jgi:uridine kinase